MSTFLLKDSLAGHTIQGHEIQVSTSFFQHSETDITIFLLQCFCWSVCCHSDSCSLFLGILECLLLVFFKFLRQWL